MYEEKQPRQQWKVGRILELITSNDGEIRQANVIVGKTKRVINRPINRLYSLEKHLDKVNEQKELTVERAVNVKHKRSAAIIGEIKRRFMSESINFESKTHAQYIERRVDADNEYDITCIY